MNRADSARMTLPLAATNIAATLLDLFIVLLAARSVTRSSSASGSRPWSARSWPGGIAGGAVDVGGILVTVALAVAFVAFFALGGTRLMRAKPQILEKPRFSASPLLPAVILCLGLAALAAEIGLAAVIGAFLAGMMVAETKERTPIEQEMGPLVCLLPAVLLRLHRPADRSRDARRRRDPSPACRHHRAGDRDEVRRGLAGSTEPRFSRGDLRRDRDGSPGRGRHHHRRNRGGGRRPRRTPLRGDRRCLDPHDADSAAVPTTIQSHPATFRSRDILTAI